MRIRTVLCGGEAAACDDQGHGRAAPGPEWRGGAGIQAGIKGVTARGGCAMTAVTAITVQNTLGVTGIHEVPLDIVVGQMRAVMEDLGVDAVKTGMLHNAEIVEAVAEELSRTEELPVLVVDPVMIAKGGASLLEASAVSALKEVLIPLSALVTPNIPEAEVLTGRKIVDGEGQKAAADALLGLGADAVFVKGGHLSGDLIFDVLATQETIQVFSSPRIDTRHTHGTGCALASSIAALLAQGIDLTAAVAAARDYVHEAIRTAPGFGQGHGPLNFLAAVDDGEL